MAVRLTEGSRGQGKKHLLKHHILKQKPAVSIIPYFSLIFGNGTFAGVSICTFGSKDEVKAALDGDGDRLHAASAEDLKIGFIVSADADIVHMVAGSAMLNEQVGLSLHLHRSYLAQVWSVLQHPRLN